MPSGPKKRKAARKKKENQHNSHSGDGDTEQCFGGEGEVGQLSSSISRVRRSRQKLSTDGGKEEIGKGYQTQDTENSSTETEDDRIVKAVREFEIGKNEHDGRSEDDESMKKSWTGSSSEGPHSYTSSSSSNSDDECHDITDTQAKPDVTPVVDSLPEKSVHHPKQEVSAITQESGDSVAENLGPGDPAKCSWSGEEALKDTSTPANNCSDAYAVEHLFNESKEQKRSSIEDNIDRKDEVFIQSSVNIEETDDKSGLSHTEPRTDTNNGVECEKLSRVTEPLLPPVPRPVQMTSWKNCCGLFELFSGSGR